MYKAKNVSRQTLERQIRRLKAEQEQDAETVALVVLEYWTLQAENARLHELLQAYRDAETDRAWVKLRREECVCAETSSRNCPVHGG